MQVQVPAGNTQELLTDIDQAPNGATLHLSGTYNVSNTGHEVINGDDWYSGIVVNKALTLDGGKLQSDGSSNVVDVGPQGNLKLEGGIWVTGGYAEQGAGIYNAGIVVADNAYIWGNAADDAGGGVYNLKSATFTLNGGQVGSDNPGDGNKAINGGGIANSNGTVTINGGTIENNSADRLGGGIENTANGTVNVNGGSITGNHATESGFGYGGGIDNNRGTVNLTGGRITGNTATQDGGGIYNNALFTYIFRGDHQKVAKPTGADKHNVTINGLVWGNTGKQSRVDDIYFW